MPFEWGFNDCALFAADAVQAMTGEDPAPDLRGYDSEFGAIRTMKENGWAGVEETLEAVCNRSGFYDVPVAFARRGDVLLLECALNGHAAGVVGLDGQAIGISPTGPLSFPIEAALRAWRVP
jgi:hypothetical protein